MRCCGSPTTSTVPNAEPAPRRGREVAAEFNALLIEVAFKPLASAMGFYGELVVGSASQAIARRERGGLTDRLERALESESASRSAASASR